MARGRSVGECLGGVGTIQAREWVSLTVLGVRVSVDSEAPLVMFGSRQLQLAALSDDFSGNVCCMTILCSVRDKSLF